MAERLVPELVRPERTDRRERAHDIRRDKPAQCGVARLGCGVGRVEVGARSVHELHDGADRGIELLAIEVLGALGERAMALPIELLRSRIERPRDEPC